MEGLSLELSLVLKAVNNVLVTPTDLMRQTLGNGQSLRITEITPDMPSQCKTCGQASTVEPSMPREPPFASSCRKGEEHPRIA